MPTQQSTVIQYHQTNLDSHSYPDDLGNSVVDLNVAQRILRDAVLEALKEAD